MNEMQGTKPSGWKCNRILDAVVIVLKYNKIAIHHAIYIKLFSDGTVSYLTVSTDDVLDSTNNSTSFTELTRVFEEHFDMKVQGVSFLKY